MKSQKCCYCWNYMRFFVFKAVVEVVTVGKVVNGYWD